MFVCLFGLVWVFGFSQSFHLTLRKRSPLKWVRAVSAVHVQGAWMSGPQQIHSEKVPGHRRAKLRTSVQPPFHMQERQAESSRDKRKDNPGENEPQKY